MVNMVLVRICMPPWVFMTCSSVFVRLPMRACSVQAVLGAGAAYECRIYEYSYPVAIYSF